MTSMQRYKRAESIDLDSEFGDNADPAKSLKTNRDFVKRIHHAKCKVIQLAREQIKKFNKRQAEIEARMRAANTVWNRIRKRSHLIVIALIVGILVWMSLVYGALLGASLCSSGQSCFPFISFHAAQVRHSLF